MDLSNFRLVSTRILSYSVAASALLIQTARAGDHHQTVYLVPAQTTTAAAAPVATSTAQYVLVYPKHGHGVVYQVAPTQAVQMVQASAAPVYYTMTSSTGAAPVAAKPGNVVINGITYVPQGTTGAAPVVGAAPESGALTPAQRTEIGGSLTKLVGAYKLLGIDDAELKDRIQKDATTLYETKTGKTADAKAIDSLTSEALGSAPAAADASRPATTTPGQQQTMMVPAAAPVQYFLPVKVKHNLFHQYP